MLKDDSDQANKSGADLFTMSASSQRLQAVAQITVLHPDFKCAVDAVERCLNSAGSAGETICISILGDPGCGKSHLSNRFLRLRPSYRKDGQLIKPVVRVRVPSDPTVKGVSTAILQELGDPNAPRGSDQDMAKRIDHFIQRCRTTLVILEEVNHFVDAESEKRNIKVCNWMKIRIEETGIPWVIEGLPRTKVLFDQDQQLNDRLDGPYYLNAFKWFTSGEEPALSEKSFCSYMRVLSKSMPFNDCIDFGVRPNALRFFCQSHGTPRAIGKLLKQTALLAEMGHTETIDLKLLSRAYDIKTGFVVPRQQNPFSQEFDLTQAELRLKKLATRRRGTNEHGEMVFTK